MRHALLIFSFLFIAGLSQPLQAQNGVLFGSVIDKSDRTPLPGVNIILRGTTVGTSTDFDGKFEIRNIRPGEYSVEVSFIGFERQLITGVNIKAGTPSELKIEIAPQVLTSEDELVVIGEKPIFDVEKSNSSITVGRSDIEASSVSRIDDVVALQSGVTKDPTGLYIKGGRQYETGFVVDGVSAQDPLSGTGFGLDIGANAVADVEVVTGGIGAEYGDATSGVVSVKTRDGGDRYSGFISHKRDNFGSNTSNSANFFTDVYEFNLGGPAPILEKLLPALGLDLPGTFTFFVSGQVSVSDEFTKTSADQVKTSAFDETFWSPRQDNRFNGLFKLTWNIKPGMKFQGAYQRSLIVNQNVNMLRITDASTQIDPGFQFRFSQDLNNANTFAAETNLSYLKWTHTVSKSAFYDVQISRLFTTLRVDANGRDWRPTNVEGELDPESIITNPIEEFDVPQDFTFILPGPGFVNNGGLATLFHDHFAEETTLRSSFTKLYNNGQNQFQIGGEFKFNDYQWIDITRPWVGAPIEIGSDENGQPIFSQTSRLGESSDIWRVKPKRGGFFVTNQMRYKGLIANVGLRFEYWAPGKFVDDAIRNPDAPILDVVRQDYLDSTTELFGLRFKTRLLPKISVSFPVRENQVLFFNYGHATRLPHPSFVYAGLDPFFQDRSFLASLGNPNLDPEVSINYEIGLRNQITANDALNISAFWNDRFDFVTSQRVRILDATGRETERAFRINGDFARSRGVEVTYIKRYKDWFRGQLSGTFSRAEGLSSSNDEATQNFLVGGQQEGNNVETPLAWDRPLDLKANFTFTYDRKRDPLFGVDAMNQFQFFISSIYRSGRRYTPVEFKGFETNPVTGEQDWRPIYEPVTDPEQRFSKLGPAWFIVDMNVRKWFYVGRMKFTGFMEISNLFNRDNAIRVNPVTGEGFPQNLPSDPEALAQLRNDRSLDVPNNVRDPRFLDPRDRSLPRGQDPSNFLEQRHIMFGLSIEF